MEHVDVIVIGGGAAGLMCAITAGQRGRKVLVLEGSNRIGKKILMSGGGRCNFTNLETAPSHFLSANPKFCISALSRYTHLDIIALIEKHGIGYHEKTLGQLFCDETSKDIVAMLAKECEGSAVSIETQVSEILVKKDDQYIVDCRDKRFTCDSLVIATGGLSIPKMGASDFGYRIAEQFGLALQERRAGLVPFTLTGAMHQLCSTLSGVSCPVVIQTNGKQFSENMLFTHRGLSGPAVLQASNYWVPGDAIEIDLLPDVDGISMLQNAKSSRPRSLLRVILTDHLPKTLVLALQELFWADFAETPLSSIKDSTLRSIAESLHSWLIRPAATEGYRTAEVTLGGVCTSELSSQTMECKAHPDLYFVGEVVDVTGELGGHNFQWAWSSGYVAGQSV